MGGSGDYCSQSLPARRIAADLGGGQLLELPIIIGQAESPTVELVDSDANHHFLSEQIAQLSVLHLDMSARLDVHLADRE